jgi:cytosine/uracil/thiamine/allantoin permease
VIIPLLGLIINALGWAGVVMSMVARGGVVLLTQGQSVDASKAASMVVAIGLLVIVVCWLLLRGGLNLVRRLNDFVGPALIVLATVTLILLVQKFGLHELWNAPVRPQDALTTDPRTSLAYAVEFGIVSSMSWWPYVGGLYRLLKYRRHAVSPPIFGGTLIGGAYCSGIAALAAANCATADPVVWIISLAGRPLGTLVVALLLLMNLPTICMLIYFAAISIQQMRLLARVPWGLLVAILLAPLTLVAFHTLWTVSHVMTIATYCGVQFVAVAAIEIVDFYILRRQSLAINQVFSAGKRGQYWFWGGFNYVAIAVILVSIAGYLLLYDPVTLATSAGFRYFGAAIPVFIGSGALYYVLTRLITIPSGRGGLSQTGDGPVELPITAVKL